MSGDPNCFPPLPLATPVAATESPESIEPPLCMPPRPPAESYVLIDDVPLPDSLQKRIANLLPFAISACVNLLMMFCLALVALPLLGKRSEVPELTVVPWVEEVGDELAALAVDIDARATSTLTNQQFVTAIDPQLEIKTDYSVDLPAIAPDGLMGLPSENRTGMPSGKMLNMPLSIGRASKPPSAGELRQATSIEQAVDGVAGQIHELLENGDLLVVWLLDASLSLVDDRQRIAARLDQVYKDIARDRLAAAKSRKQPLPRFRNAVVAYGGGMAQVLSPTHRSDEAVEAIASIPLDATGLENVFSAVQTCVGRYAASKRMQVMLVVWTDESGDDIALLEPTIERCKQRSVRVNVIGPTAVLGAEGGTHAFVHPADRKLYWLPVKKGPDTAFPERILWPYWWQGPTLPVWHDSTVPVAPFGYGWYGGPELYFMASGFPPYALMRLTRETGGNYTVFDRSMDRGPFTLEQMRAYAPDHRSADEIFEELHYYPLRHAVMASVETTRNINHQPPTPRDRWMFMGTSFIRQLLRNWEAESKEACRNADLALRPFGPHGMEDFHAAEESPRWRAWYDLTRGRLLAQSVRHSERIVMCRLALRDFPENANCIHIAPFAQILSGPEAEQRAREAERLLRRCVAEHPATPWAYLAERELAYPLGIVGRIWFDINTPPVGGVMLPSSGPPAMPNL